MILFDDAPATLPRVPAEDLELLAQPTRLAIVLRLRREGELNATAIGAGLTPPLAQPTVSRHLKVLTTSGLLRRRQRGAEAYFRIDDDRARRLGQQLVDLGSTLTAGGDRHGEEDGRTAEPDPARSPH